MGSEVYFSKIAQLIHILFIRSVQFYNHEPSVKTIDWVTTTATPN